MQILLNEPINLEDVADLLDSGGPRDKSSWHVSNLLESAELIVKGQNQYHEYEGAPNGRMSMGRIWENVVDGYLARFARQGDGWYLPNQVYTHEGVVASLDGVMFMPAWGLMVAETKLRFSKSTDIPFRHQQQIRAYCHMVHTNRVIMTVLRIAMPIVEADLRIIEYTQESIDENWQMIINTKNYLESKGIGPKGGRND